jgi:uncharacterized protein (TIGR03067 family)
MNKGDLQREVTKFQGTWTFESVEAGSNEVPTDALKGTTVTFEGDRYTVKIGDEVIQVATLMLDPAKSPEVLDATVASTRSARTR